MSRFPYTGNFPSKPGGRGKHCFTCWTVIPGKKFVLLQGFQSPQGVGPAGGDHRIFSCFTFRSITWREASSAFSSGRERPISTMSTMAWYARSPSS